MKPNVASHVPTSVFLRPLVDIKALHQIQKQDLECTRVHLNEMMVNIIKSHEALPMHIRPRQLFALETELQSLADGVRLARAAINQSIGQLHQIAQDAKNVDPQYREDALRIVFEAEKIALGNIQTIDTILEEVDLNNSKLLTIH
jgi:hypothetical protein